MTRVLLAVLLAAQAATGVVRIAPVADRDMTEQQRNYAAAYVRPGKIDNLVRVLLNHPDSLPGVMPFWNYIEAQSTLSPHDRAVLITETGLRTRSEYLVLRYPGQDRPSDPFDVVLQRAAAELHDQSFVTDATWGALSQRYGTEQLMDALFTVAETTMMAGLANSTHLSLDPGTSVPRGLPQWPPRPTGSRAHPVLAMPRIPPLEQTFWTGDLRVLLDPDATGRPIAAVYRTFAQHIALAKPRQELSEYIRTKNTLPPRLRELAILRIGFLCGSDYEWGAHAPAGRAAGLSAADVQRIAMTPLSSTAGWTDADAAVIRATDELYTADAVSDATWNALTPLDVRQRIDLLITIGGYRMVSMALNTLGVPLEDGAESIPK